MDPSVDEEDYPTYQAQEGDDDYPTYQEGEEELPEGAGAFGPGYAFGEGVRAVGDAVRRSIEKPEEGTFTPISEEVQKGGTLTLGGSSISEGAKVAKDLLVGAAKSLGTIGNLLDSTVGQAAGPTKSLVSESEAVEKMKKGETPSFSQMMMMARAAPLRNRIINTQDVVDVLGEAGIDTKPHGTAGKFAQRFGEYVGAGLQFGVFTPVQSFVASTVGQTIEEMGGGPGMQVAGELTSMILGARMGQPSIRQYNNSFWQGARESLQGGPIIQTGRLESNLQRLARDTSRGLPGQNSVKQTVLGMIEELEAKASSGHMEVQELMEAWSDINNKLASKGVWESLDKTGRADLNRRANQIKDVIDEEMRAYGQHNPAFYQNWRSALEGERVLHESRRVRNTIRDWFKNPAAKAAVGAGVYMAKQTMGPKAASIAAAAVGSGFGLMNAAEAAYRAFASPVLRQRYINMVHAAAQESAPALSKAIKLYSEEAAKEDSVAFDKYLNDTYDEDE